MRRFDVGAFNPVDWAAPCRPRRAASPVRRGKAGLIAFIDRLPHLHGFPARKAAPLRSMSARVVRVMLVCHCNIITEKEIEAAIISLLDDDPWQLLVPAKVYHSLKKRGRCCGCFPNVVDTIIRVTEEYHRRSDTGGAEIVTHLDRVRALRGQ